MRNFMIGCLSFGALVSVVSGYIVNANQLVTKEYDNDNIHVVEYLKKNNSIVKIKYHLDNGTINYFNKQNQKWIVDIDGKKAIIQTIEEISKDYYLKIEVPKGSNFDSMKMINAIDKHYNISAVFKYEKHRAYYYLLHFSDKFFLDPNEFINYILLGLE